MVSDWPYFDCCSYNEASRWYYNSKSYIFSLIASLVVIVIVKPFDTHFGITTLYNKYDHKNNVTHTTKKALQVKIFGCVYCELCSKESVRLLTKLRYTWSALVAHHVLLGWISTLQLVTCGCNWTLYCAA